MSSKGSVVLAVVAMGAVLACASGSQGTSIGADVVRSYRSDLAAPAVGERSIFTVPPDRALVGVALSADTSGDVRAQFDAVASAFPDGCAFTVLDYRPPGRIDAVLDVSFAGLADERARIDRLGDCFAKLHSAPKSGWELAAQVAVYTVDRPGAHFDALVARLAETQQAAASIVAPGVHPADRRCVPTGAVQQISGRLSGVELALEMSCAVAPPAPVPPAG